MISDKIIRKNLVAMCVRWSVCSFSFALIEFYAKYLPGNIYFTKGLFGVMDAMAVFYVFGLDAFFESKVKSIIRFCLITSILL